MERHGPAPCVPAARRSGLSARRKLISDTARAAYRGFPLTASAKRGIKATVFRTAPWLVRHTEAYRAWQRQSTAIAPLPQPTGNAEADLAGVGQIAVPLPVAPLRSFGGDVVEYVPQMTAQAVDTRIKAIAFYLPQFHPIPENDRWWGKGFTEWHNVARGRAAVRRATISPTCPASWASTTFGWSTCSVVRSSWPRLYGLHGFCYHHYWFGGTATAAPPAGSAAGQSRPRLSLLSVLGERELDAALGRPGRGDPHRPAAFAGRRPRVHPDIEAALRDDRYIRVDGRPLLVVYRPALLPDASATAAALAHVSAASAGLADLFLVSRAGVRSIEPA